MWHVTGAAADALGTGGATCCVACVVGACDIICGGGGTEGVVYIPSKVYMSIEGTTYPRAGLI